MAVLRDIKNTAIEWSGVLWLVSIALLVIRYFTLSSVSWTVAAFPALVCTVAFVFRAYAASKGITKR